MASEIHNQLPLALLLDIDAQRRLFGHYKELREESRVAHFALAYAMLEHALSTGRDVVIDKMLYDQEILNSYRQVAEKYGAEVTEVILWAPKEVILKRATERGYKEGGLLTPEKVTLFWDHINEMKDLRPDATVIDVTKLSVEEVCDRVKELTNI